MPLLLLTLLLMIAVGGCDRDAGSESTQGEGTRIEYGRPPDGQQVQGPIEDTVSRETDAVSFSGESQAYVPGWELDSIGGEPPVRGLDGRISFMYGEMNGNFACRTYYLKNRIAGEEMTVDRKIYHDTYGCREREGTAGQEATFAGALDDVESIRVEENRRLTLTGVDGTLLVFSPPTPPPTDPRLKDSEWLLTSLLGEPPVKGTEPNLTVDTYALSLDTGCNAFGAEFVKFAGGELSLSKEDEDGLMGTAIGCPTERADQENRYLDTFESVTSYRLSGGRLSLSNDGGVVLVYSRGIPRDEERK